MLECSLPPKGVSAEVLAKEDARVFDANGPLLRTLLASFGCDVIDLGHAADDPAALRGAVERSAGCDVLVITGGMSAGRYDFVPPLLVELGYALRVRQLKMRPGKPFVFGERDDVSPTRSDTAPAGGSARATAEEHSDILKNVGMFPHDQSGAGGEVKPANAANGLPRFVFGLPGNPVSGYVGVVRLAGGLLARLGAGRAAGRVTRRTLAHDVPANGPREAYLPATVDAEGRVKLLHSNGSADVFTLAAADVLAVRSAGDGPLSVGQSIDCWEL